MLVARVWVQTVIMCFSFRRMAAQQIAVVPFLVLEGASPSLLLVWVNDGGSFALILIARRMFVLLKASGDWYLAATSQSCEDACNAQSRQCSDRELHDANYMVDSETKVSELMQTVGRTCLSFGHDHGSSQNVPLFNTNSGRCLVSDSSRNLSTFSCSAGRWWKSGRERLCYCVPKACAQCLRVWWW